MNIKITEARELLLTWMANSEDKRSYEMIRKTCCYLDTAYGLGLGDNAVGEIFTPLLRCGIVDFVGGGFFALTDQIAIKRGDIYVYTSVLLPENKSQTTSYTGILLTRNASDVEGIKVISFDAYSILKTMPSVDKIIDNFPKSVEDLSEAEYYHRQEKRGLTKRFRDGVVVYFSLPEKMYQREIPGRDTNPDAFNIAYCYSQSVNSKYSGYYNAHSKRLVMAKFGLPIMIERILMLESMTLGYMPSIDRYNITFDGITKQVVKELNRILCKIIRYE